MGQYFESEKCRIQNIDWEYIDEKRPSYLLLVDEFFRRANNFLDFIHYDPNRRGALFSAADRIGADLPEDVEKEIESVINQIPNKNTLYARVYCISHLKWAYLVDQEVPVALRFHDLYDPVIRLFERGGRIYFHRQEMIFGRYVGSRNISEFRNHPPIDIRDEALAEYDNAEFHKLITNCVSKYMEELDLEDQNKEEIVNKIFEQMKDYTHSTAKEMVIDLELANWLLEYRDRATKHLKDIRNVLEGYKEKWLPEEERKELFQRMEETLNRLNQLDL